MLEITIALFLNVILLREKLAFQKMFIFSYHYLGVEDKLCKKKGAPEIYKSHYQ